MMVSTAVRPKPRWPGAGETPGVGSLSLVQALWAEASSRLADRPTGRAFDRPDQNLAQDQGPGARRRVGVVFKCSRALELVPSLYSQPLGPSLF